MKNLEKLLKDYEIDIENWESDFGEGHLFLAHREALIPYEKGERVVELDKKAIKVLEADSSKGSDKIFLNRLKKIVKNNIMEYAG